MTHHPHTHRAPPRQISALARALQQSRRLAIVRFVKRANTQPLLAYLSPCACPAATCPRVVQSRHRSITPTRTADPPPVRLRPPAITAEAETLMCVRLPFAEDIRDFEFPPFLSDPAYQPSNGARRQPPTAVNHPFSCTLPQRNWPLRRS